MSRHPASTAHADSRMTATERRASTSLAAVFALRMLGLFIILPIFSIEAEKYSGGNSAFLIGLALGIYGLTQAIFQIPMGWASDKWGRKPVIAAGLLVFALGGALAASTDNIYVLIAGRALQGAGTVSAAVTALLADLTRDSVRTKGMAIIGISIGVTFALSLIIGAPLNAWIGLSGIFWGIAALALLAIMVVYWITPHVDEEEVQTAQTTALHAANDDKATSIATPTLLRLYVGVFILHAVQLAMWSYVPHMLLDAGLAKPQHWHVYLPALVGSLLLVGGVLFRLERKGYLRLVFLLSIGLLALALAGLAALVERNMGISGAWWIGMLLCLFFCGFNALEASQPSLVSQYAHNAQRGSALGIYNAMQSLGLFAGGAIGGWILTVSSPLVLFSVCAAGATLWFVIAWGMPAHKPHTAGASVAKA